VYSNFPLKHPGGFSDLLTCHCSACPLQALSLFRHPNIAALFAYAFSDDARSGAYYLLYEFADKGALDGFLESDLREPNDGGRSLLSFRRRVQIAVDVFTAIRFLHVGNKEIRSCFHRDIKSPNIVIKRDFTAQLIDCGIAKFVNDDYTSSSTGAKGTPGYICPEYVDGGIPYTAACDIYSFGVVLTELWTGRLQNYKDESGSAFNFAKKYLKAKRDKLRDLKSDVDPFLESDEARLPDVMGRYADLALACMAQDIDDRPEGEEVLSELISVLEACLHFQTGGLAGEANPREANRREEKCSTCRTYPIEPSSSKCHFCNQFDLLHEKIDSRNVTMDSMTAVLARMDLSTTPVPRLFLLVPADKATAKNPRSWIKSCFTDKYYLYFVCAATYRVVEPHVKVRDPKRWFKLVSPLLALSLYAIKIGARAGLSLDLDLDGAASDLLNIRITSEQIQGMLDACLREVEGVQKSPGLLDRFKKNKLTPGDVEELYRDPYRLVAEEAQKQDQCAWRTSMEPVRKRSSAEILWVAKEVAEDPKYEYEIVRK
jgi:serine/threonine protein kinase